MFYLKTTGYIELTCLKKEREETRPRPVDTLYHLKSYTHNMGLLVMAYMGTVLFQFFFNRSYSWLLFNKTFLLLYRGWGNI